MEAHEETYLGGTFLREISPYAGALASLDHLNDDGIRRMAYNGEQLRTGINRVFSKHEIPAAAIGRGSLFHVIFAEENVGRECYVRLRSVGIHAEYAGTHMISAALTPEHCKSVIMAFDEVCRTMVSDGAVRVSSDVDVPSLRFAVEQFMQKAFNMTAEVAQRWSKTGLPAEAIDGRQ